MKSYTYAQSSGKAEEKGHIPTSTSTCSRSSELRDPTDGKLLPKVPTVTTAQAMKLFQSVQRRLFSFAVFFALLAFAVVTSADLCGARGTPTRCGALGVQFAFARETQQQRGTQGGVSAEGGVFVEYDDDPSQRRNRDFFGGGKQEHVEEAIDTARLHDTFVHPDGFADGEFATTVDGDAVLDAWPSDDEDVDGPSADFRGHNSKAQNRFDEVVVGKISTVNPSLHDNHDVHHADSHVPLHHSGVADHMQRTFSHHHTSSAAASAGGGVADGNDHYLGDEHGAAAAHSGSLFENSAAETHLRRTRDMQKPRPAEYGGTEHFTDTSHSRLPRRGALHDDGSVDGTAQIVEQEDEEMVESDGFIVAGTGDKAGDAGLPTHTLFDDVREDRGDQTENEEAEQADERVDGTERHAFPLSSMQAPANSPWTVRHYPLDGDIDHASDTTSSSSSSVSSSRAASGAETADPDGGTRSGPSVRPSTFNTGLGKRDGVIFDQKNGLQARWREYRGSYPTLRELIRQLVRAYKEEKRIKRACLSVLAAKRRGAGGTSQGAAGQNVSSTVGGGTERMPTAAECTAALPTLRTSLDWVRYLPYVPIYPIDEALKHLEHEHDDDILLALFYAPDLFHTYNYIQWMSLMVKATCSLLRAGVVDPLARVQDDEDVYAAFANDTSDGISGGGSGGVFSTPARLSANTSRTNSTNSSGASEKTGGLPLYCPDLILPTTNGLFTPRDVQRMRDNTVRIAIIDGYYPQRNVTRNLWSRVGLDTYMVNEKEWSLSVPDSDDDDDDDDFTGGEEKDDVGADSVDDDAEGRDETRCSDGGSGDAGNEDQSGQCVDCDAATKAGDRTKNPHEEGGCPTCEKAAPTPGGIAWSSQPPHQHRRHPSTGKPTKAPSCAPRAEMNITTTDSQEDRRCTSALASSTSGTPNSPFCANYRPISEIMRRSSEDWGPVFIEQRNALLRLLAREGGLFTEVQEALQPSSRPWRGSGGGGSSGTTIGAGASASTADAASTSPTIAEAASNTPTSAAEQTEHRARASKVKDWQEEEQEETQQHGNGSRGKTRNGDREDEEEFVTAEPMTSTHASPSTHPATPTVTSDREASMVSPLRPGDEAPDSDRIHFLARYIIEHTDDLILSRPERLLEVLQRSFDRVRQREQRLVEKIFSWGQIMKYRVHVNVSAQRIDEFSSDHVCEVRYQVYLHSPQSFDGAGPVGEGERAEGGPAGLPSGGGSHNGGGGGVVGGVLRGPRFNQAPSFWTVERRAVDDDSREDDDVDGLGSKASCYYYQQLRNSRVSAALGSASAMQHRPKRRRAVLGNVKDAVAALTSTTTNSAASRNASDTAASAAENDDVDLAADSQRHVAHLTSASEAKMRYRKPHADTTVPAAQESTWAGDVSKGGTKSATSPSTNDGAAADVSEGQGGVREGGVSEESEEEEEEDHIRRDDDEDEEDDEAFFDELLSKADEHDALHELNIQYVDGMDELAFEESESAAANGHTAKETAENEERKDEREFAAATAAFDEAAAAAATSIGGKSTTESINAQTAMDGSAEPPGLSGTATNSLRLLGTAARRNYLLRQTPPVLLFPRKQGSRPYVFPQTLLQMVYLTFSGTPGQLPPREHARRLRARWGCEGAAPHSSSSSACAAASTDVNDGCSVDEKDSTCGLKCSSFSALCANTNNASNGDDDGAHNTTAADLRSSQTSPTKSPFASFTEPVVATAAAPPTPSTYRVVSLLDNPFSRIGVEHLHYDFVISGPSSPTSVLQLLVEEARRVSTPGELAARSHREALYRLQHRQWLEARQRRAAQEAAQKGSRTGDTTTSTTTTEEGESAAMNAEGARGAEVGKAQNTDAEEGGGSTCGGNCTSGHAAGAEDQNCSFATCATRATSASPSPVKHPNVAHGDNAPQPDLFERMPEVELANREYGGYRMSWGERFLESTAEDIKTTLVESIDATKAVPSLTAGKATTQTASTFYTEHKRKATPTSGGPTTTAAAAAASADELDGKADVTLPAVNIDVGTRPPSTRQESHAEDASDSKETTHHYNNSHLLHDEEYFFEHDIAFRLDPERFVESAPLTLHFFLRTPTHVVETEIIEPLKEHIRVLRQRLLEDILADVYEYAACQVSGNRYVQLLRNGVDSPYVNGSRVAPSPADGDDVNAGGTTSETVEKSIPFAFTPNGAALLAGIRNSAAMWVWRFTSELQSQALSRALSNTTKEDFISTSISGRENCEDCDGDSFAHYPLPLPRDAASMVELLRMPYDVEMDPATTAEEEIDSLRSYTDTMVLQSSVFGRLYRYAKDASKHRRRSSKESNDSSGDAEKALSSASLADATDAQKWSKLQQCRFTQERLFLLQIAFRELMKRSNPGSTESFFQLVAIDREAAMPVDRNDPSRVVHRTSPTSSLTSSSSLPSASAEPIRPRECLNAYNNTYLAVTYLFFNGTAERYYRNHPLNHRRVRLMQRLDEAIRLSRQARLILLTATEEDYRTQYLDTVIQDAARRFFIIRQVTRNRDTAARDLEHHQQQQQQKSFSSDRSDAKEVMLPVDASTESLPSEAAARTTLAFRRDRRRGASTDGGGDGNGGGADGYPSAASHPPATPGGSSPAGYSDDLADDDDDDQREMYESFAHLSPFQFNIISFDFDGNDSDPLITNWNTKTPASSADTTSSSASSSSAAVTTSDSEGDELSTFSDGATHTEHAHANKTAASCACGAGCRCAGPTDFSTVHWESPEGSTSYDDDDDEGFDDDEASRSFSEVSAPSTRGASQRQSGGAAHYGTSGGDADTAAQLSSVLDGAASGSTEELGAARRWSLFDTPRHLRARAEKARRRFHDAAANTWTGRSMEEEMALLDEEMRRLQLKSKEQYSEGDKDTSVASAASTPVAAAGAPATQQGQHKLSTRSRWMWLFDRPRWVMENLRGQDPQQQQQQQQHNDDATTVTTHATSSVLSQTSRSTSSSSDGHCAIDGASTTSGKETASHKRYGVWQQQPPGVLEEPEDYADVLASEDDVTTTGGGFTEEDEFVPDEDMSHVITGEKTEYEEGLPFPWRHGELPRQELRRRLEEHQRHVRELKRRLIDVRLRWASALWNERERPGSTQLQHQQQQQQQQQQHQHQNAEGEEVPLLGDEDGEEPWE